MKTLIIAVLTTIFSCNIQSAVWSVEQSWTQDLENSWSEWIASDSFHRNIFFSNESPYYGIKTDCTDALIALRAIFSYENKLPFSIKLNKQGLRISQASERFDKSENPLKAFIEYIGLQVGTDGFARLNTYPVYFDQLRPGDFYLSKWKRKNKWIFHGEVIKKLLDTGHLVTFYSTSPVLKRRLAKKEGFPAHLFPSEPFGFRRFLREDQDRTLLSNYKQYQVIKESPSHFFKTLKEVIKLREDTVSENLARRIGNLCRSLEDRKYEVNAALQYQEQSQGKCTDQSSYDAYSTPSRDGTLYKDLNLLMNGWKRIRKSSAASSIDLNTTLFLDFLIRKSKTAEARNQHRSYCKDFVKSQIAPIGYTLKNFFDKKRKGLLTYHPNDSFKARWGLSKERTNCPKF